AAVALAPARAAVLGQPDARGRDGEHQAVGLARPRDDGVQAQPTAAGLPLRAGRVLPERMVERPGLAAVPALEQDTGIAAHVEDAVALARGDDPEALEGLLAALGQRVEAVAGGDRRLLAALLAVDEDVDVAADPSALVQDPAGESRLGALEGTQDLGDGRAVEVVICAFAGALLQRATQADEGHMRI